MKINIHLIIVTSLVMTLVILHYLLINSAYDFTIDEASQDLTVKTLPLTLTTWEERCISETGEQTPCRQLQHLQPGDILVTKSSFSLFYRHGHIGLVLDTDEGKVIEALGYGNVSTVESLEKWNDYPTVQILRLKNDDQELIEAIVDHAMDEYIGIPYSIFATGTNMNQTHCSVLIWKIFNDFGFDLNSTGGKIITPRDIANSEYLETIAAYGFGIDQVW